VEDSDEGIGEVMSRYIRERMGREDSFQITERKGKDALHPNQ